MNTGAIKNPRWTPAEDAILRSLGPTTEAADLVAMLPGRTLSAVFHRLERLGIEKRRRWTEADDTELEATWGTGSIESTAKQIGRTVIATYWRAQKLGLGLGVPVGCERLHVAVERCGYGAGQLRKILDWAGVRVHAGITRVRKRHHMTWVEPTEVDAAVAEWHKTETPHAAARARGMTTEMLINRLMASGLLLPAKPAGRKHWRVPSATIDRAISMVSRRGKFLFVNGRTVSVKQQQQQKAKGQAA